MNNSIIDKLRVAGVNLEVVNGKLKVDAPKGALTADLLEDIKSHKKDLMNLLSKNTGIPKADLRDAYPLTPTQYFMWFTHEHMGGGKAYNITSTLKLDGQLNVEVLTQAFRKVVERHESLRTNFVEKEDKVAQVVLDEKVKFDLSVVSLPNFSKENIKDKIEEEYQRSFELDSDLLVRGKLITNGKDEHILLFVIHHIIGDGWSLQILTKEVMSLYNSLINNTDLVLPELDLQYKDYSVWLDNNLNEGSYDDKLDYWKTVFSDSVTPLQLPSKKKRPAVKTYNGCLKDYTFSNSFYEAVKSFARQGQATPFMVMMAGINGLFARYTGQYDITLGTTVAGRSHGDLEEQIGLYSNALAVRTKFSMTDSFKELLVNQKEVLSKAYDHKEYPFTELVRKLDLPKDKSRSPLFDIMVLFQNHKSIGLNDQKGINDLSVTEYKEVERGVSQQDITFIFVENEEGLKLSVEYNSDIFDDFFIDQLIGHLKEFIGGGLNNPNFLISEIDIVTEDEVDLMLLDFNHDVELEQNGATILDLLREQVEINAENTALIFEGKELSYKELDEYSNQLAGFLVDNIEYAVGNFVGVEMHRGAKTIITIVAILKAGGVYVPIDPNYPKSRKEFIAEDSQCKIIITEETLNDFYTEIKEYDTVFKSKVNSKDLAYVIYTSGSTGNPKGVQITHASLADYAITFKDYFKLTEQDRILQQASISFDTSIEEIFPILASGGTLVVQEDKTDFEGLLQLCDQYQITVLSTNPFVLQYLNQVYDKFAFSFRILISGGDVLKPAYINNIWEKVSVYNTYGPTESTVCATYHKVNSLEESIIPIGKPIRNRQVYILESETENFKLCPIGVVGELCIAGAGLSAGYLNRPELNTERFVDNPFIEGTKMYRSGDLARWTQDGTIEFLGRKDSQVKVRGYRIELEEIEYAMLSLDSISEAVVLIKEKEEDKFIVAYVEGAEVDVQEVRNDLAKQLPAYMMPSHIEVLDQIPLTSNGKIDKKALQFRKDTLSVSSEFIAPQTEVEKDLATIWEEVLGREKVGLNDNFFEMGGHSLKVVKLVNRIQKELGYDVKVNNVFNHPTIKELVSQLNVLEFTKIPKAGNAEDYPVTASQRRLWVLSNFEGGSAAYNIVNTFEFEGAFNYNYFSTAIRKLITRHESLRTSFRENANGELRQIVSPAERIDFEIPFHNIGSEKSENVKEIVSENQTYTFDLSNGPLLKVEVIKVKNNRHLVLFNLHHIVGDGWSMEILLKEVVEVYNGLAKSDNAELIPLKIQYKDFAVWSNSENRKERLSKAEAFWKEKLGGEIPVLELSSDLVRPKVKTYNGASFEYGFSNKFSKSINDFVRKQGATLFMGLMAGVNGLLYNYTGQSDIILGTPVAGRVHPDLENQVGLFLNTLAIRTKLEQSFSFLDLLLTQKETLQSAYEHQHYPFDQLVDSLNLKRDASRSALFDIMLVLHNQQDVFDQDKRMEGLTIKPYNQVAKNNSQFDLTFSFSEKAESISVSLEYNTDVYTSSFIEKLAAHLEQFVIAGIEESNKNITQLDYLSEEEKQTLLVDFNSTQVEYPVMNSLVDLLEQQAEKTPDATAVIFEEKEFSYRFIQDKSNQLANYLLEECKIESEDFVGLKLPRDEWMVISLMAILKAGATYVPIDPKYPAERIEFIESDSNCKVTISESLLARFKEGEYSSKAPMVNIDPEQIAYVIYTSGSTGKPKGVMIKHSNVVSLIHWSQHEFANTDFDLMYAVTSYCFDLSVFEIFFPLTIGKRIRILENGLFIEEHLPKDEKVLINTVPSVVRVLQRRNVSFDNVVAINMAGEPVPITLSNELVKLDLEIRNLYGPSEDTTYSSVYRIQKEHQHSIPIGVPVANTKFYVLSESLQLQARSAVGELCIAGEKLSKGYLNRPELTDEKFIPNPFEPGTLMYKTGDLVRWMPDGNLEFLGRKDHQVKLRGYRIELGEIEHALQGEKGIDHAVVLIKEVVADDKQIVGYLSGNEINAESLRTNLLKKIPGYMVPAHFVLLDSIPLTPNGKTDEKKLLALEVIGTSKETFEAPNTKLEKKLVTIWESVLSVSEIGVNDDFFNLGGHSINAIELLSIVHKEFNVEVKLEELFMNPTIHHLASSIENVQWVQDVDTKLSVKKITI